MKRRWMQVGAVTFAAGVLISLMIQAGMTSGCSNSRTPGAQAEPKSAPSNAAAPADSTNDEPPEEYLPASKAGPIFRPKGTANDRPAPAQAPGAKPSAP